MRVRQFLATDVTRAPVQLQINHRWCSPSFGARRGTDRPDMVVLHYTAMESCKAAAERLCDPQFEVSAHYLIGENGVIHQLVDEVARAWHAGRGAWGGITDVNSHSIGIELANTSLHPFPDVQMVALESLLSEILNRYKISPARVIGHSDMAPGRKSDPGVRFDWQRLARQGLSIWPKGVTPNRTVGDFYDHAARFGYPTDASPEEVLNAFRLRFRPHATGPLNDRDLAIITELATRFPVDLPSQDA